MLAHAGPAERERLFAALLAPPERRGGAYPLSGPGPMPAEDPLIAMMKHNIGALGFRGGQHGRGWLRMRRCMQVLACKNRRSLSLTHPFPSTLSLPFPHTKTSLPRSGNFVAQRLIETADEPLRSELLGRVRLHAPLLRRLPYCKRLLARLERAETPPPPPPAHLLMRHQMPQ